MAAQGNIFGISAGSGTQGVVTVDLTTANNIATAILIELRQLNLITTGVGAGLAVTDDPNTYRLDAQLNGFYSNPPISPSPGQD